MLCSLACLLGQNEVSEGGGAEPEGACQTTSRKWREQEMTEDTLKYSRAANRDVGNDYRSVKGIRGASTNSSPHL